MEAINSGGLPGRVDTKAMKQPHAPRKKILLVLAQIGQSRARQPDERSQSAPFSDGFRHIVLW
jgi:hypothetical protein